MTQSPSITFRLDPRIGVAPYRQLVEQVRLAVLRGLLQEGDQLPSVRDVVTQITINPNTVHRAYRELEYKGVAQGRAGLGTFITSNSNSLPRGVKPVDLDERLRIWVTDARQAGMDEDLIREHMRLALRRDNNVPS